MERALWGLKCWHISTWDFVKEETLLHEEQLCERTDMPIFLSTHTHKNKGGEGETINKLRAEEERPQRKANCLHLSHIWANKRLLFKLLAWTFCYNTLNRLTRDIPWAAGLSSTFSPGMDSDLLPCLLTLHDSAPAAQDWVEPLGKELLDKDKQRPSPMIF